MPDPRELSPQFTEVPEGETAAVRILDDATSELDKVRAATVDDPDNALNPMRWTPVPRAAGLFFPKKGDNGTVIFPEGGDEVLIEFFPAADAEPDHAF